jgi:hypothetical protein
MKTYVVRIQVIKVYDIKLGAETDDQAIADAYDCDTTEIQECGSLQSVETDYAEVVGVEKSDETADS